MAGLALSIGLMRSQLTYEHPEMSGDCANTLEVERE